MNRTRDRSCETKVRYDNMADAHRAAARLQMHVYYCEFCGGWHLAAKHKGPREQKRTMHRRRTA
jgi:hypothetical protein